MRDDHYPKDGVIKLIQTNQVSQNTSAVLKKRLKATKAIVPVFFELETFQLLRSVCKQLVPQASIVNNVDLATLLDDKMNSGEGKGWRYNKMPPDKKSLVSGLTGIDETAAFMFNKEFVLLNSAEKNKVLRSVQTGFARGKIWEQLPSNIFFEDLLASLVELYYSHPLAKEEIGEVAFADAKGWQRIGLDELEEWEPRKLI